MKDIKRFIVLLVSVCIIVSGVTSQEVSAGTVLRYDAEKALKYASEHCNDKTEWDGTKQDCVEFVRTCVEKGGVPRDAKKIRSQGRGYTVKAYIDYLVDNGYADFNKLSVDTIKFTSGKYYYLDTVENEGKASPGDILVYKCTGSECGKYFHMALLSKADTKGTYKNFFRHYAHNCSINNKVVYAIRCSKCRRKPAKTEMYAIHFKSVSMKKESAGWHTNEDGEKYYVNSEGYRVIGFNKVGDYYYLFDNNGVMKTGNTIYEDREYLLGDDGKARLYTVKTLYSVNYRTGASIKYKVKGTFKEGTVLDVIREKNGWGKVNNGYWIKLEFAEKYKEYPVFKVYKIETTDYLNYRTGPGTGYLLKGTYKPGKKLTVINSKNGWGKTKSGYWIKLEYTKRI